ncbi:MAG: hypothetical protein ACLP7P_05775 [Rhodomicrobium sp.]
MSIEVVAHNGLLPDGENWYTNLFGTGLHLHPKRIGPPSPEVLDAVGLGDALLHVAGTSAATFGTETQTHLTPWSPLNTGEQAGLDAYRSMYDIPGFGHIAKNDDFTLQFLGESNGGANASPLTPEDAFTQQMSEGSNGYSNGAPAQFPVRRSGELGIPLHAVFADANLSQSMNALNALLPPPGSQPRNALLYYTQAY